MTATQIDSLGYVPIAGASKPILHMVLRRKGELYHGKRYLTWSHGSGHFVDPVLLDKNDKDTIKNKLRREMKFEIHFTVNDNEDYFIIEGQNIAVVWAKTIKEMSKRNLKTDENNMYSVEI